MTILEYLEDLDRKGYTVMPAEITRQDVLSLVYNAEPQTAGEAHKALLGEPNWEIPWSDDYQDLRETQENALDIGLQ